MIKRTRQRSFRLHEDSTPTQILVQELRPVLGRIVYVALLFGLTVSPQQHHQELVLLAQTVPGSFFRSVILLHQQSLLVVRQCGVYSLEDHVLRLLIAQPFRVRAQLVVPQHRTVLARVDLGRRLVLLLLLRAHHKRLTDRDDNLVRDVLRLTLEHVPDVAVVVHVPADDAKVVGVLLALGTTGHVAELLVQQHLLAIGANQPQIRLANQEDHCAVLLHDRNRPDRGGSIAAHWNAENLF